MAAKDLLCLTLWIASVFTAPQGCPELCNCSGKILHHAECSFKGFTEVPHGFSPNVTILSLSANKISAVPRASFQHLNQVLSLWMSNNKIASIEQGTLAHLVHLRNFDISHNKIVNFPWEDLQNLTRLQLLKMNHNNMTHLPKDALSNLKDLRSLHLNNNKFITIPEGTFAGLVSLSHLQLFQNPFACTCALDWLREWISATTINMPQRNQTTCESPEKFKGQSIEKLPKLKCASVNVAIRSEPFIHNTTFYEGSTLILTCEFSGSPRPLVMWSIHSQSRKQELALPLTVDDSAESNEVSLLSHNDHRMVVYKNGTLIMSHLRKDDSGKYSCSATNEFARAEDSLSLRVLASPTATPRKPTTTASTYTETHPERTAETSVFDFVHHPDLKGKDLMNLSTSLAPITENGEVTTYSSHDGKCVLTADTRNVSSHVLNGSLEDFKQNTFDFGVIALGTSETEATVRLNPFLIPQDKNVNPVATNASGSPHAEREERLGYSSSLSLCITDDRTHTAVQWSRIKEGVNTYAFSGLRPGTNYSLCLTHKGEDCVIRVVFATRKRVPNFLIIISVSICLLTVSTVPLLGATCFHLVYKYRSKTYKLILKAKDQCQMESSLAANFNIHAPHTESQRKINDSQLDEEGGETESGDGDREADTEESVMTESLSFSQCRGVLDNCEVGSEYSDRLPLGAEAINIVSNYKYPNE